VLVVGFDTATPAVSVAVHDGERVVAEASAADGRRHGELLMPMIAKVLADAGVAGFRGSTAFRLDGQAPWLSGSPAYVDWYLVDGSAVLDPLNEAAVWGTRRGSHDVLARAMGAGAGSLLQLCDAAADVAGARWATWLSKPRGMPYDPFYQRLGPVRGQDGVSL